MKDGRPTSFDIAYRAGVSQSTVSRALRNSPQVNQETREKVQRIARELNYRVDKNATALRSQSSKTIALLIFEDPTEDESHINPFFFTMLGHITRTAADRGFDLLVSFQQLDMDWHLEYELSSRADGMILLGYGDYTFYQDRLVSLKNSGAHFIIWGPNIADLPGLSIGCDNNLGGTLATRHLIELGHQRFAFLGNVSPGSPEFRQRYEGYCAALKDAGIDPEQQIQIDCENTEAAAVCASRQLLDAKHRPTAVVAASDLMAIGAANFLKNQGLSVPNDLSITGFDDISSASYAEPPLTTVRQNTKTSSQLLVDTLIQLIKGEAAQSAQVEPTLVVRESTAKVTR